MQSVKQLFQREWIIICFILCLILSLVIISSINQRHADRSIEQADSAGQ